MVANNFSSLVFRAILNLQII